MLAATSLFHTYEKHRNYRSSKPNLALPHRSDEVYHMERTHAPSRGVARNVNVFGIKASKVQGRLAQDNLYCGRVHEYSVLIGCLLVVMHSMNTTATVA